MKMAAYLLEPCNGPNIFGNACGAPRKHQNSEFGACGVPRKRQNSEFGACGCPANIKTENLELAGCPANTKTRNLELAGRPANTKTQNLGLAGRPANTKTAHSRLAVALQGIPIGKGAPFLRRIRVDLIAGICLGFESDTRLITIISAGYDFRPKSGEEGVRRGVQTMLKATSYRADARNAVHFVLSLRHVKHRFSMKYD